MERRRPSVFAIWPVMRATGAMNKYRALDARQRRQREMAYPDHEIRPLIERDSLASAFCHPLFEVKASLFRKEYFVHRSPSIISIIHNYTPVGDAIEQDCLRFLRALNARFCVGAGRVIEQLEAASRQSHFLEDGFELLQNVVWNRQHWN